MGEFPDSLNHIGEPLRAPVALYATRLRHLADGHLLALVVFGEAATGNFVRQGNVVQSAAVFDTIHLESLRALGREGPRLGKHHIAAPLVFTPEFLQQSCDTFPLELIEIQQRHVVILGTDYFGPLTFQDVHVRLQCERELKVISVGMHQGLLASADSSKHLKGLNRQWSEHLLRPLRGALWLKGIRQARNAMGLVEEAEKLLARPLPGVRVTLSQSDHDTWEQFLQLYADVQSLAHYVNAI